jgi:DNA-directed RNA polymerase specialized sigma24 family protein
VIGSRRDVFDKDSPTARRVLAELKKPRVREDLLKLAAWRTGDPQEAEDLLEDALILACDPEKKPWNADIGFKLHMTYVFKDLWIEHWRSARAQLEIIDTGIAQDPRAPHAGPLADEALHYGRKLHWLRTLGDRLLADFGDSDPLATASYHLSFQGIDEPREQAVLLECGVEDINDAKRRLKQHGARIREQYEEEEAERMAEARKRAKKKTEDEP